MGFFDWVNRKVNGGTVDKALKELADMQNAGSSSPNKEDFKRIAKVLAKHPKLLREKGYGYLSDFAEVFPQRLNETDSNGRNFGSGQVAAIVTRCIISKERTDEAKKAKLLAIAQDIKSGKAKSLSMQNPRGAFALTTNISIKINHSLDSTKDSSGAERAGKAATAFISECRGESVDPEKLSEAEISTITRPFQEYPSVIPLMAKDPSIPEADITILIGHGSSGSSPTNQASRYFELEGFKQESRTQIKSFLQQDPSLTSPESKAYLAKAAIGAAQHLRNDYSSGMNRGRTKVDIDAQLGRVDVSIQRIQNSTVIASSSPIAPPLSTPGSRPRSPSRQI